MATYENTAPLPFQGQKRNFVKMYAEAVQKYYNDDYIFVDLFGGSGLLSHVTKRLFPNSRVIYNDYDDYSSNCQFVEEINSFMDEIRKIDKEFDVNRNERVRGEVEEEYNKIILKYKHLPISLIEGNICFSGSHSETTEQFLKAGKYCRCRKDNYNVAMVKNFHKDLEVVKKDWAELVEEFKDYENVVFIADPPYFNTDIQTYKGTQFTSFESFLKVNDKLKEHNHIFFTSTKSFIVDLHNYLVANYGSGLFMNDVVYSAKVSVNNVSSYEDKMIFSFKDKEQKSKGKIISLF